MTNFNFQNGRAYTFPSMSIKCSLIVVLLLWFTPNRSSAQQLTPEFEMQLFFEDAMGNRDTVEMGFDPDGYNPVYDDDILDSAFGEYIIEEAFDPIFEVRAFQHGDFFFDGRDTLQMSKRIIGHCECSTPENCTAAFFGGIAINSVHLPVTVSYDPQPFIEDYCLKDAVILTDELAYIYPEWYEAEPFYCLSNGEPIILDFEYFETAEGNWFEYAIPVEGQGRKTIPLLMFDLFLAGSGPCPTSVPAEDVIRPTLGIYPNPTRDVLNLTGRSPQIIDRINIIDISGKLVAADIEHIDGAIHLPEALSPGVNFLQIFIEGDIQVVKFVKM